METCVERWVRDFAADSKRHALLDLKTFTEITGIDAPKFLDFAKTNDSVDTFDLIRKARDSLQHNKPSVPVRFENHMRSFLKHNGVNNLPTSKNTYVPESWHRGYKREELKNMLSYLGEQHHRLFVHIAIESGLRAQNILDICYRHIREDYEAKVTPCAIRFEPKFYNKSKSAGFTFLSHGSLSLIKGMISAGIIKPEADARLIGVTYPSIQHAIMLAKRKARIPAEVQTNHGFRKFFENQLDRAELDTNRKAVIEGHFSGTRAKHYSDREWDQLREDYAKAAPFLDLTEPQPAQIERDKILDNLQAQVAQLTATIQKMQAEKQN
jgi:hypothetical protein